jgi:hypothetical protein
MPPQLDSGHRWVLVPLAIFGVTRVLAGLMLFVGSTRQAAISVAHDPLGYRVTVPTPASPGYLGVVSNWDGQWFRAIAESGYPSVLPQVDGHVVPNEWAFTAGYPFLVRLVMSLFTIEFPLAASVVSIVCAAIAMVLLYGMVRVRIDSRAAASVVIALCCFPSAPVFQVAYAESLSLLLIVLALDALARRRHAWLVFWAALLAVTRPIMLPLAAVSAAIWLVRWRRRHVEPFPVKERWTAAGAALSCVALVALWPLIAAVSTRSAGAFTQTMAAWPVNDALGGPEVNWLTLSVIYPPLAVLVVPILMVVAFAAWRRPTQALPREWRWWGPVYMLYILAATKPSAGILRYLLLAVFPLAPFLSVQPDMLSGADKAARRIFLVFGVMAGLVGQYYWATKVFTIDVAPTRQVFP